jgi:hypothetical protein
LPRFHYEAKKSMSIVFMNLSGKMGAGGCDRQHAKQIGVANVPPATVNKDPDMRYQIATKGAVSLKSGDDGMQSFGRPRHTVRLLDKVPQFSNFILVTG